MSKDGKQLGHEDPIETSFDEYSLFLSECYSESTEQQSQIAPFLLPGDAWRDPSTETETVRMLIDAALSCPFPSDAIPSSSLPIDTAAHDTTAQRTVAPRRRKRKKPRQSWHTSDLQLACIAFGAHDDNSMRTSSSNPMATRASARLRKGEQREPEQCASVSAPAIKRPKRRSELGGHIAAASTTASSALPRDAAMPPPDASEQRSIDYVTDKANLVEAIESRAAAMRNKEHHTMASLYKARIERQILLTARQTIDMRLRELNARRARIDKD